MDRGVLEHKALTELREIASALQLTGYTRLRKADLIERIIGVEATTDASGDAAPADADEGPSPDPETPSTKDTPSRNDRGRARPNGGRESSRRRGRQDRQERSDDEFADAEIREGVLDLLPEGYGFLRTTGYLAGPKDVYVSQSYVRRFQLRRGDKVAGPIRSNNRGNDKFPALARVDTVDGLDLEDHLALDRPDFDTLTPVPADQRLDLGEDRALAIRLLDLLAPLGAGQRGVVIAPPKGGRTTLLVQLAQALENQYPNLDLLVLLIDERPEQVTEFARATGAQVISSTFDQPAEDHTQVTELTLERAKRLVERGRDVVLLIDSLTRLARAHQLVVPASGHLLTSGLDAAAMQPTKRVFAAARNTEDAGSLTIVATVMDETGSAIDETIREELRGTDTMQLRLVRRVEQHGVFPVIDVHGGAVRHEEKLRDADELTAVRRLRRRLAGLGDVEALSSLLETVGGATSNRQVLKEIAASDD